MLSDRCPVLPVTLVYSGQTAGRITMKLDKEVGLGPGHIVLVTWGSSSPSTDQKRGTALQFSAHVRQFEELCEADYQLFNMILHCQYHVLEQLLPPALPQL